MSPQNHCHHKVSTTPQVANLQALGGFVVCFANIEQVIIWLLSK